jgi:hypothetical protein
VTLTEPQTKKAQNQQPNRKQTQKSHYGPPQQKYRAYCRNDNNKRLSTINALDNYQKNAKEMIATDHPQEIAPTPRRTAQVITTEMVHHSMKKKIKTRQLTRLPRSTQQNRNYQIHDVKLCQNNTVAK